MHETYISTLEENKLLQSRIIDLQGKIISLQDPLAGSYAAAVMSTKKSAPNQCSTSQPKVRTTPSVSSASSKQLPEFELRVNSDQTREATRILCSQLIRKHGLINVKVLSCRLAKESIIFKLQKEEDRDSLRTLFSANGLSCADVSLLDPELGIIIPNDCLDWSDEDLVSELQTKNDITCTLLKRTVTHFFVRLPTPAYRKLTNPETPAFFNLGKLKCFLSLRIKRCFKCHSLGGHTAAECPNREQCGKCSSKDHSTSN